MSTLMLKPKCRVKLMGEVEYLTWKSLNRANNRAIRLDLNRQIKRRYIKSLDRDKKFPISFSVFDDGYGGRPDVIRYVITTDVDGDGDPVFCHLDIPVKFTGSDVFKTVLEMKP